MTILGKTRAVMLTIITAVVAARVFCELISGELSGIVTINLKFFLIFFHNSVEIKMLLNALRAPERSGVDISKHFFCTVYWIIMFGLLTTLKMISLRPQIDNTMDVGEAGVHPPVLHNPAYYTYKRKQGHKVL